MNRSLSLWRNTAAVCVCMTLLLGAVRAFANAAEVNMGIPVSEKPVPFSPQESAELAAEAQDSELASTQCGDDAEVVLVAIGLFCLLAIAVAVAVAEERHRDREDDRYVYYY